MNYHIFLSVLSFLVVNSALASDSDVALKCKAKIQAQIFKDEAQVTNFKVLTTSLDFGMPTPVNVLAELDTDEQSDADTRYIVAFYGYTCEVQWFKYFSSDR